MNDLSEVDRRGFSRKRDFSEEIHLPADWSSIDDDFWLFWGWKNEDRCLIDWDDDDRSLNDNFPLSRDWIDDWIDRPRFDDSDFRDPDRDCACHE
jgi:hypothetical protein